nr:hypothetical protein [Planococcus salinarum]
MTTAIIIGWLVGILTEVGELVVSLLVALLAGGVILNVMKEELPEERESSFLSFAIGMMTYSILWLLI